ncbi:hypothetical protein LTR84_000623 [Exophiala bonariae]|uniref:NmrA-like domain-containing protein n=1 Tax=Exophiala bonariae TaxID=1690606 RepID=A0AAV9NSV6_9EURO|nr:hypothetical protein LTR84_000623 [Exophiala bonariae]
MSKKILTIFGATGNQGGSTLSAVLNNPTLAAKYKIRAITRDPSKPSAQSLASRGAELAQADLNDIESVKKAIAGSHGVFAVTNYWETMDKNAELQQGKNIVDACKSEAVKHLVWSSLPHAEKLSNGELSKIEHFDSKAGVQEYAEQVKGDDLIVSYFMPAYFMSNLPTQIKASGEDGVATLSLPWNAASTWLPMIDIRNDTGLFTVGLFEAGERANGFAVQGTSQWLHPQELVDTLSAVSGKPVKFVEQPLTVEAAAQSGNKIAEELAQNMLLIRDYSYFGKGAENKQDESDKFLVDGAKKSSFKQFAEKTQWQF